VSPRVFISFTTAVFAALGLLACGGGGGDDEQAIKRTVERSITTKDAALKCDRLGTKSFVTRVYGSPAQCHAAERPAGDDQPPTGASTSDVKIDGDSATIKVRLNGGDSDGASGTIALRKVSGDWRVDDLGVDFLRSQVRAGFANASGDDDDQPLSDPKIRDCATRAFGRLGDQQLRRIAYMAIAETDEGKAQLGKLLSPCLTTPSAGAGNISFLRQRFESGITSGARKDGMSPRAIACINRQLRSSISDVEISKLAFNGVKPPPAIKRHTAEAFGRCQGASGSRGSASVLRQLFERGVRRGATQRGVPKKALDCLIRRLRRTISDDEIVAAMGNSRTKAKLTRKATAQLQRCAAVTQ